MKITVYSLAVLDEDGLASFTFENKHQLEDFLRREIDTHNMRGTDDEIRELKRRLEEEDFWSAFEWWKKYCSPDNHQYAWEDHEVTITGPVAEQIRDLRGALKHVRETLRHTPGSPLDERLAGLFSTLNILPLD